MVRLKLNLNYMHFNCQSVHITLFQSFCNEWTVVSTYTFWDHKSSWLFGTIQKIYDEKNCLFVDMNCSTITECVCRGLHDSPLE